MKLKTTATLLLLLVVGLLSSCNGSGDDNSTKYFLDIVTIQSMSTSGTTLTFRQAGDSPLITLTTTQVFDNKTFKEGSRILIQYSSSANQRYVSGPITVMSAIEIEGSGQAVDWSTSEVTNSWASSPVTMSAAWRSGEYVNLEFDAVTNGAPKSCRIVVDSETKDSECPHLHLIFDATPGTAARTYRVYGSWNIKSVWNNPYTRSIRVYAPDPNMNPAYITITKDI